MTRERDVLLEDKAQLVKKQDALRIEKENRVARLAEQGTLLVSSQKQQDGLTASLKAIRASQDRDRLLRTERALQRERDRLVAQLTETRQQQEGGAAEIVRLRRQVEELDEKRTGPSGRARSGTKRHRAP